MKILGGFFVFKMDSKSLVDLYVAYIRGTPDKTLVVLLNIFLCNITKLTSRVIGVTPTKVHITTKVVKHIHDRHVYDKIVQESEVALILQNLEKVVRYPNHIYNNKPGKTADYLFVKKIKLERVVVLLQIGELEGADGDKEEILYVVSSFVLRDEGYLKGLTLLWDWEGGLPPS